MAGRGIAVLSLAWGLLAAPRLQAQNLRVGDPVEDYLRVLQVAGVAAPDPFVVRPLSAERAVGAIGNAPHPWRGRIEAGLGANDSGLVAGLLSPQAAVWWNSTYPWGQNDGVVWQGRGAILSAAAGAYARWGMLRAVLRPVAVWNQNRAFPLVASLDAVRGEYTNPWHDLDHQLRIDQPQRFGDSAFSRLDLGESALWLDWHGVAAGMSQETMWWGPGMDNAIVLSNNAPGIPHGFLGTSRPVDVGIGRLSAHWIWGRLRESEYFDDNDTNDVRYVTGIVGAWEPSFLPGLTIGGTRAYMQYIPEDGLSFRDYVVVFQGLTKKSVAGPSQPGGDDARDQLLSLFLRWALPAAGFEVYGEWARNDHSADMRDFLLEPEHSQGYTLGFQKVMGGADGGRLVRLRAEATRLERSKTLLLRETPPYYTHHIVRQGYTHRGQVLGAGIGTGSNSQVLALDVFTGWGRVGGFLRRQVHDNDAYYELYGPVDNFGYHDVDFALGATGLVFVGPVTAWGSLAFVRELNRNFNLGHDGRNDVSNLHAELTLRWTPPVRARF
jgi:hypothetical protein